jgi:hypothetical protein
MIKTMFLMPVTDNDGRPYAAAEWEALESRLLAFGGFSLAVDVTGVWQAQGRVYRDLSRQYTVALTSWQQLPAWLEVVLWARSAFRQLAVYIEVGGIPEILEL